MLFLALLTLVGCEYVSYDLDSSMTLGWEIEEEDIRLQFECKIGWCGIGFGDSMRGGTDMIIVNFQDSDISPTLLDCWSEIYTLPPTDASLGGISDLELLDYSRTETDFTVIFRRPLSPADIYDYRIKPDSKFNIMWAYLSSGGLAKHSVSEVGEIRMGTTAEKSYFKHMQTHEFQKYGVLMSLLWGVLAPVGVIIGRYFKWWKWWYEAHLVLFTTVVVVTIIGANLVVLTVKNVYSELDYVTIYHSRMGFTIACLVVGQGLLGLLVRVFQRYIKYISMITHLRLLHQVIGWSMSAVGFLNVYTGWKMHKEEYLVIVLPYQAVIMALMLFFEVRHRMASITGTVKKLPEVTHLEAIQQIATKGRELVFFDELVLDVNAFKFTHPGGTFMVRDAIGEDVGKYLVGTNSYGSPYAGYLHSAQAFDMARHLAVAQVKMPESFCVPTLDTYDYQDFVLVQRQMIADKTWLITLVHPTFKINSECLYLSWIGKHFRIQATIDKKPVIRYYSHFFVNLESWKTEVGIESAENFGREEGSLQLIYKDHGNGTMTAYLSSMEIGMSLSVAMPFGPGISTKELQGHYVGIVAGTGIVPLIDLVYWMYRNRDNLDFTFTLVTRCRSWKEYYIRDVLDITEEMLPGVFSVIYCNSDGDMDLKTAISEVKAEKPNLVWVCGPSGFNRHVINSLLKEPEYPRDKIINF